MMFQPPEPLVHQASVHSDPDPTVGSDAEGPLDTCNAFRPQSPWWGAMLCPAAVIVGRWEDGECSR
jgi:hypothetical protein